MYEKITKDVKVKVEPVYLEQQSEPEDNKFFWAYHVVIENLGSETVQLTARYWHITDSLGHIQEVSGEGVVGEQPVLKPGESYEYTSGTPLKTPDGIMTGRYHMKDQSGQSFNVEIPAFSLDSPHNAFVLH